MDFMLFVLYDTTHAPTGISLRYLKNLIPMRVWPCFES